MSRSVRVGERNKCVPESDVVVLKLEFAVRTILVEITLALNS